MYLLVLVLTGKSFWIENYYPCRQELALLSPLLAIVTLFWVEYKKGIGGARGILSHFNRFVCTTPSQGILHPLDARCAIDAGAAAIAGSQDVDVPS